jgi:hypothetical protein
MCLADEPLCSENPYRGAETDYPQALERAFNIVCALEREGRLGSRTESPAFYALGVCGEEVILSAPARFSEETNTWPPSARYALALATLAWASSNQEINLAGSHAIVIVNAWDDDGLEHCTAIALK